MDLTGEYRIPASREQVWAALNDTEVLKASIPGCDSLEKKGDNAFAATVTAKVGPVKAKFQGEVTLSDMDPPNGYTITGEGKGGAAGFAKGGAKVRLSEDNGETVLRYEVDANVGGKLAQIGSRLIEGTARKLADEFFTKFSEQAAAMPAPAGAAAAAPTPAPEARPAAATEVPPEVVKESFETGEAAPEMLHVQRDQSEHPGTAPHDMEKPASVGLPAWVWVAGVIVVVLALLYAFAS